jgi:secondary thiamine-phosphate synthase enzyme
MRQHQETLAIKTGGQSLTEFTRDVARIVKASLLIQENADPDVQRDLLAFFKRLIPDGDPLFIHRAEGPDDMPAHVKSALTQTALSIPISDGRMMLGTWQGIYLFEHRARPHTREVIVHVVGD